MTNEIINETRAHMDKSYEALATIYQTGLDAHTYTDRRIQELRDEIGGTLGSWSGSVGGQIITDVTGSIEDILAEERRKLAAAQAAFEQVQARDAQRLVRKIDAGDLGAALRHALGEDAAAAADVEDALAGEPVEVDEAEQVVQFVEVVLVEIGEKAWRPHRVNRDVEVVDTPVPVSPDI